MTTNDAAEDGLTLFPRTRWSPLVILALTVAVRMNIVLDRVNLWILHPDEVFQSIEIAHSEVYGYGFRAYEYLPPPRNNSSVVENQEASLGMYSMRSFLLPRVYMLLFHLKELIGLETNPFMFAKICHAMTSSVLPVCVFHLTSTVYNSNDVAVIAAVLVSFSSHLTTLGTHTLVNSFLAPFVFYFYRIIVRHIMRSRERDAQSVLRNVDKNDEDINRNLKEESSKNCTKNRRRRNVFELIFSGFVLGALCYIRVDLILFFGISLTVFIFPIRNLQYNAKISCFIVIGVGLGVLLGGIDDRWSYGKWFISPIQWFDFNVLKDMSTGLFGWSDWQYYIRNIFLSDSTMIFLTCTSLISFIFVTANSLLGNELNKKQLTSFRLLCLVLILLLFYTMKGHKEIRFLHNVIVVFLLLSAAQIEFTLKLLMKHVSNQAKYIIYIILIVYSVKSLLHLPTPKNKSNQNLVYGGIWDSNYINMCIEYVGSQDDVTGVFLDRTYHMTGAFSLLHKDVPWFTLIHNEFNEFDKKSRVILPSVDFLSTTESVRVSVLNRISEYITTYNSPLVLKHLINNPKYNYLIISRKRKFINIGFDEVYSYGTMKVLKRSTDKSVNNQLENIGKAIPIGRNATILEYEGSWLKTLGKSEKAIERLKLAIELDPYRIRAYQLLKYIYIDLRDRRSAIDIHNKCAKLHGNDVCNKIQPRVILYKDYDILK